MLKNAYEKSQRRDEEIEGKDLASLKAGLEDVKRKKRLWYLMLFGRKKKKSKE